MKHGDDVGCTRVRAEIAFCGNDGFAAVVMGVGAVRALEVGMIPAARAAMLPMDDQAVSQQNGGCDGAARC